MPYWLGIYQAGGSENGFHAYPLRGGSQVLWRGALGTGCPLGASYSIRLMPVAVQLGSDGTVVFVRGTKAASLPPYHIWQPTATIPIGRLTCLRRKPAELSWLDEELRRQDHHR